MTTIGPNYVAVAGPQIEDGTVVIDSLSLIEGAPDDDYAVATSQAGDPTHKGILNFGLSGTVPANASSVGVTMVVKAFGEEQDSTVNLQLYLDGTPIGDIKSFNLELAGGGASPDLYTLGGDSDDWGTDLKGVDLADLRAIVWGTSEAFDLAYAYYDSVSAQVDYTAPVYSATRELGNEVDAYIALGPIPAAGSGKVRLRLRFATDGTGIPFADFYNVSFAVSVSPTNAESEEALGDGDSLLDVVDGGASGFPTWGGTDIPIAFPYVSVGNFVEYLIPVPEFEGADRYIIIACYAEDRGGEPVKTVSASIERVPDAYDQPVPLAKFQELSWILPATTIEYIAFGPYEFDRPGTLIAVVGTDAGEASPYNVRFALSETNTENEATFNAGTEIGSIAGAVDLGECKRHTLRVPAIGEPMYIIARAEILSELAAAAHTSFMFTLESPGSASSQRSRARSRRMLIAP